MVRNSQIKTGESKKLTLQYKDPYLNVKALSKNRYVVTDVPGFNLITRSFNTILSPDRIKPWIKTVVLC